MTTASSPYSGYKIELVTKQAHVQAFGDELDDQAVAIAAFEIVPNGDWRLEAYTVDEPDAAAVADAVRRAAQTAGISAPAYHISPLPKVDWLAENRRNFPPQALGRFFIHGSHFEGKPPAGKVALLVDAATAFGSGEHETTRGCLIAIDRRIARRRVRRMVDVGCGSGILAIGAAKRMRRKVIASDLDPESVRVARENAALNGVAHLVRVEGGAGYQVPAIRKGKPFDMIVANILARPLCALSRDLKRHLARDGIAILSGLLVEQEAMVLAAHRRQGLFLDYRLRRQGWSTLVLKRKRHP